jgi:hypothetical protein
VASQGSRMHEVLRPGRLAQKPSGTEVLTQKSVPDKVRWISAPLAEGHARCDGVVPCDGTGRVEDVGFGWGGARAGKPELRKTKVPLRLRVSHRDGRRPSLLRRCPLGRRRQCSGWKARATVDVVGTTGQRAQAGSSCFIT